MFNETTIKWINEQVASWETKISAWETSGDKGDLLRASYAKDTIKTLKGLLDNFEIQEGDFIKAKGTLCSGLVLRKGSIKFGKTSIPGYIIEDCHGKEDFIDAKSAEFIAR